MVRVVAFDIDGTLVDLMPAITGGLSAALDELRRLTPDAGRVSLADLYNDWIEVERRLPPGSPVTDVRRAAFRYTFDRLGVDRAHLEPVMEVFFDARYSLMRLFDDVRPALAELRTIYTVGVASNGNSHAARCGLEGEFAFEVYAHVDGVPGKPHPEFFARVLAAAGTTRPDEVVYVGDSLDHDVVPAQAAGLRTVWVDRAGTGLPEGYAPDAVVKTLTDLPGVLR
jgi:HAD superfamily hydrolase (TIGR01549 family)